MTSPAPIPLSALIRERSAGAHSTSEGAGFMASLLRGERSREDYIALVAQHHAIYSALEGGARRMRRDPIAARFLSERLTRLPALEADLAFLLGPSWRDEITPLPATARYVRRIEEVAATWPGGFVAHHYTRYLGDLSGGLHIGRVVARQFGFETNGIGFYIFGDIADPAAFKDHYRAELDAAPWDDAERERVVAEVLDAYRFNTEVFVELAADRGQDSSAA
ncbi:heme oxygenase (biliverdin-producing) [Microbacterium excoecariae]|uniref:biliverdin-producing heme oxygenase n=1 Tax=Microbacterium excoecariae TaxID=2715210 RepID=UPI001408309F|nr:biliverdin-producing heme oxygenase [Microbacterium excoecariae]NHI17904.1 biliverdin-producing heme oxygenase [Microbacterium excoecariae]